MKQVVLVTLYAVSLIISMSLYMRFQMVHARVSELEKAMSRQKSEFFQRDQERQIHFEELLKIKEAEIHRLKEQAKESENTVAELRLKLKESHRLISDLHDKSRVFDEVIQCKPVLESMVRLLNVYESCEQGGISFASNDSATPPPKSNITSEPKVNGYHHEEPFISSTTGKAAAAAAESVKTNGVSHHTDKQQDFL